jgi:hypothetical protein
MSELTWRKSTFSGAGADCVEMAAHPAGPVLVRNSHHPDAGTLTVTPTDLGPLFTACRAGHLDDLTA